jgi:3-dehydroquinate dehydratase I
MILHSKSKNASLLRQCSVVGSLSMAENLTKLFDYGIPTKADVLELRLDLYPEHADSLAAELALFPLPLLITARCQAEGSPNPLTTTERAHLLRTLLPVASIVDLEIQSLTAMSDLVAEIKASPALLLASFHHFSATPTLAELESHMHQAVALGADAVKFATTLRDSRDLATLMALLALPERPPLSVMGMGPLGKLSRLALAQLGSILNYGYCDAATVPGQWESARLKSLLQEISTP